MCGIELRYSGFLERRKGGVGLRFQVGGLKLLQKILDGRVCEANVGAGKILVEYGSAEETRELLFFGNVARHSENMAVAGEYGAGDLAVQGMKINLPSSKEILASPRRSSTRFAGTI